MCNSLGVTGQGFNESGNISTQPAADSEFPARGVGSLSLPQFVKDAVVNISFSRSKLCHLAIGLNLMI